MTTTDTPTPLTPLDERRLAVLGGVFQAVEDGRTTVTTIGEVQALADWVLQGDDSAAQYLAEGQRVYLSARARLDELLEARGDGAAPAPHAWTAGDVVSLKQPSPGALRAGHNADGWVVTERPPSHGVGSAVFNMGYLYLRHEGLEWGIQRRPDELVLVTPAGAPS